MVVAGDQQAALLGPACFEPGIATTLEKDFTVDSWKASNLREKPNNDP